MHWAKALLRLGDNAGPMFKEYHGEEVLHNVTYSVKRNMGLGDIILVTPVLRKMREVWPWAKIKYYTERRYLPLLRHNPYFEACALEDGVDECAMTFDLCGVSETDSARMFQERIDVYARHVGVTLKERLPVVFTDAEEKAKGAARLREHGWEGKRPLLGVQLVSSRPERDYDCARAAEAIRHFYNYEGYDIALFHNTVIDWEWGVPVVNMTGRTADIEQLMDVVSNCSLFMGVDSGITHIAAAHGIPTVALTGAIKGSLRYACYPKCVIVERELPCTAAPRECYSCHKGTSECMLHEPRSVIAALGSALCR